MEWTTIDFEASCLPRHGRSFPIEVGICGRHGTASWLIRPAARWRDWDWTQEAFALHGITRERLDSEGLDPAVVVAEVRRAVGTARPVADSTIDRRWWQTLVDAAEPDGALPPGLPDIAIEHVAEVFARLGAGHEQILFAQRRADRLCPERHRAGADSRWLHTLLTALEHHVAADREATASAWPKVGAWDLGGDPARRSHDLTRID